MPQSQGSTPNFVSEEQLREQAINELGIQDLEPDAQEEVMATVRETLLEYINIAVMRALGPKGMMAFADIGEDTDAFSKKLVELLPNIGGIVKGAIEEGLQKHQAAIEDVRRRFGVAAKTSA